MFARGNSHRARKRRKDQDLVSACRNSSKTSIKLFMHTIVNIIGDADRDRFLFAIQLAILSFLSSNYFKTLFIMVPLCHVIYRSTIVDAR